MARLTVLSLHRLLAQTQASELVSLLNRLHTDPLLLQPRGRLGADRAAGSTAVCTEGNHPDGGLPRQQIRSAYRHLEGGAY